MGKEALSLDTRRRLLEAALEVFAQCGYRDATFREICRRAEANNAAINYHFHDKEQLYLAVIEFALQQSPMPSVALSPDCPGTPEDRLRAFVASFLRNLVGEGRPVWLLRLASREMIEPTPGLDLLVEKGIRPIHGQVCEIVEELLGDRATPRLVHDCVSSILAQCVTHQHSRAVVSRMGFYPQYDDATIEHLTDHIVAFSLGGMRALAGKGGEPALFEVGRVSDAT